MIIVGDNLMGLIKQHNICDEKFFDDFSISLELDRHYYLPKIKDDTIIKYDFHEVDHLYEKNEMTEGNLILKPYQAILSCSTEKINIPLGYIGFVQTKGSLARLFVSAICSDSQIEPGFNGKITLELINHSPFNISLAYKSKVAQLFILKCSTSNSKAYSGRYQNADMPTLPLLCK